jgi:hypothetical protein
MSDAEALVAALQGMGVATLAAEQAVRQGARSLDQALELLDPQRERASTSAPTECALHSHCLPHPVDTSSPNLAASLVLAFQTLASPSPPLDGQRRGWTEHFAADQGGRPYYHHRDTDHTQWEVRQFVAREALRLVRSGEGV